MNKARTFVRPLTAGERQAPEKGRESADPFTVRRSPVLPASAGGLGPAEVGRLVGCTAQAVRNAIRAFEADGPGAVACYGVLRQDAGGMMLRFCRGRPVGATAEEYPDRVCRELAAEGKRVPVLVWDNAAWHVSKRVRRWVDRHNRRVRKEGGCRIRVCGLPVKAPRLNPIEPKRVHGKRAVVEPDRKLTAEELRDRVHDYYGCPKHPHYRRLRLEPALSSQP